MADLLVIANGRFQRGFPGRRLDSALVRLREIFGNSVEVYFTSGAGDATRRTRAALLAGAGWIAAAGGDGTINEVVNGYFEKDRNIRPKSPLSFLPCGSGNDWVRTLDLAAGLSESVEALARSSIHTVDVGLACFQNLEGAQSERVFLNVAEAGVGAYLFARRAERCWFLPGLLGYRLGSLATALSYPPRKIQLILDGTAAIATGPVLSLIIAGGRYFGGGMHCAPMARPDDGVFEVITLGDFGWFEILMKIGSFFSGRYLEEARVKHYSVRSIEAMSGEKVYLELDGEPVGMLPATITLIPHSLQLRY